jgi:hypothetical protein
MDENEQPCIKKVIFLFLAQDQDYIGKLQEKKGPGALEYEGSYMQKSVNESMRH